MRTNANVQCVHFPACVETRTEATLVTVLKDTQTEDQRTQRDAKVSQCFIYNDTLRYLGEMAAKWTVRTEKYVLT